MSKKHVEEYYAKMVADYTEMKTILEELQKNATEDTADAYLNQIKSIKEQVQLLEANYKRLAYIIFLLNEPNKKSKQKGYFKREHKKLDDIPKEHREDAVEEENSNIIKNIKNIK